MLTQSEIIQFEQFFNMENKIRYLHYEDKDCHDSLRRTNDKQHINHDTQFQTF